MATSDNDDDAPTPEGAYALVRKWGLRPAGNETDTHKIFVDRDNVVRSVMKFEQFAPDERRAFLDILRRSLGITLPD